MGNSSSKPIDNNKEVQQANHTKKRNKLHFKGKENSNYQDTINQRTFATISGRQEANWTEQYKLPADKDKNTFIVTNMLESFNTLTMVMDEAKHFCQCDKFKIGNTVYTTPLSDTSLVPETSIELIEDWFDYIEHSFETEILANEKNISKKINTDLIYSLTDIMTRIYVHLITKHMEVFNKEGLEPYFNSCFKSFLYFTSMYQLTSTKELQPIKGVVNQFMKNSKHNPFNTNK